VVHDRYIYTPSSGKEKSFRTFNDISVRKIIAMSFFPVLAVICLNPGVVEDFVRRAHPSVGNNLFDFLEQKIESFRCGINFDLPIPFAIARGIEPPLKFDKLLRGEFGRRPVLSRLLNSLQHLSTKRPPAQALVLPRRLDKLQATP
jgi:hypothetical protein